MQHVDLVGGDLADEFLDRRRGLVVPGDVEQQATVGVAGIVGDGDHRRGPGPGQDRRAVDPRGQELAERLDAVVEPVRGRGLDPRPGCGGAELVALGPVAGLERRGVADLQGDVARARRAGDGGQPVTGRGAQVGGQVAGDRQLGRGAGARSGDDPGAPGEGEVAAADLRRHRLRHDVERGGRPGGLPHRSRRPARRRRRREHRSPAPRNRRTRPTARPGDAARVCRGSQLVPCVVQRAWPGNGACHSCWPPHRLGQLLARLIQQEAVPC